MQFICIEVVVTRKMQKIINILLNIVLYIMLCLLSFCFILQSNINPHTINRGSSWLPVDCHLKILYGTCGMVHVVWYMWYGTCGMVHVGSSIRNVCGNLLTREMTREM